MSKILFIILIVILALLVLGNILTNPLQHHFIFYPQALEKDYTYSFANNFEEVNLNAEDGGLINAIHFTEPGAKGVVLYFHGNADNLVRWGELNNGFKELGYDLFIMDFRGFGKSKGKQTQKAFYNDAILCYEYVSKKYDSNQVIIYGRSMGSGPASFLASNVNAKHLILETPFYSMASLFKSYYPILPELFSFKFKFKNSKYIKEVKYPITIFHGTNDFIVPIEEASKLKNVLKESDEFITIEGGSHNDLNIFHAYQSKLSEIFNN
ncbi:MAG: lysophospholipase [Bacteroidia bacterium]|nr:lysophospholipase [Bacteroidia bacterium]NNC86415.1 alpha/beta fold hydrolase [Bacteroidia bacterium]